MVSAPQHLVDLKCCELVAPDLLNAITDFVNLLLSGKCPTLVQPILFGGKLIALNKSDGRIWLIAIGYFWRRLAAKCANKHVINRLQDYFSHSRWGLVYAVAARPQFTPYADFLMACQPIGVKPRSTSATPSIIFLGRSCLKRSVCTYLNYTDFVICLTPCTHLSRSVSS